MWEYVILFKKIFTSITYYHFIITARKNISSGNETILKKTLLASHQLKS